MKFVTIIFALFLLVGCQRASSQSITNKPNSSSVDVNELCKRISEIKAIPHKEAVDDKVYNALVAAGDKAIPCLIDEITNTTKMRDPRQAPIYQDVRVGDVAYFILYRIGKFDFIEMLPENVQEEYKTEGVYAYFAFVEKEGSRYWIQAKVRSWYEPNKSSKK